MNFRQIAGDRKIKVVKIIPYYSVASLSVKCRTSACIFLLLFASREEGPPHPNPYAGTLPRSWREQNLITSVKENTDPEKLAYRQNLVKTKSPSELADGWVTDFPVPKLFSTSERKKKATSVKPEQNGASKRR